MAQRFVVADAVDFFFHGFPIEDERIGKSDIDVVAFLDQRLDEIFLQVT